MTNFIGMKQKNYLEKIYSDWVQLVPDGIKKIIILFDEKFAGFSVYSIDEHEQLGMAGKFQYLDDCWLYAKTVIEAAGLTERDIDFSYSIPFLTETSKENKVWIKQK
ncbi:hypothetical protein M3226_02560 [Neobacillus cucumis]|uniref:hypothetical protein n=1 Tax=Neobacillus cucumis TaxID=1740721 RepID=UPI002041E21F|nr:hypothetical protein [Neobacillus cucumis]MCM3724584.1 hypothetical protein [Neobacillus cucumis]